MRFAQLAATVAILAVLVIPGLRPAADKPPMPEPVPIDVTSDLVPGERVVGRWQTGFYEGTVIDAHDQLVTVAWDDGSPDHSHLPRGWVQRAGAPAAERIAGQWYLCGARDGSGWQLCVASETAGFERLDGTAVAAAEVAVIDVPFALRDWARTYGGQTLAAAKRQLQMQRLVPATLGASVEKGQQVLARWSDGNWWRARVVRVRDGVVTVDYHDGSGHGEVSASDVAPFEPGGVEKGSLAICDWQGGARWWRAAIDAVDGKTLTVHYIDGTISPVSAEGCVAARVE